MSDISRRDTLKLAAASLATLAASQVVPARAESSPDAATLAQLDRPGMPIPDRPGMPMERPGMPSERPGLSERPGMSTDRPGLPGSERPGMSMGESGHAMSPLRGKTVTIGVKPNVKAEQVHRALDELFRLSGCPSCGLLGLDIHLKGQIIDPSPIERLDGIRFVDVHPTFPFGPTSGGLMSR